MSEKKDSVFRKALTDAVLARYQSIIDADKEPVVFSEEYLNSIARLTKKTQRKTWRYVNTTAKRILIAVILVILLTMTVFAAVPALREGLIRFFMHDDGIAYHFEFSEEDYERAPKEIETYYAPSWVPPRYKLESETYLPNCGERVYVDEAGNPFGFSQDVIWMAGESYDKNSGIPIVMALSSENTTVETRILHGYEVRVLRSKHDGYPEDEVVLWTDHNYLYKIDAVELTIEDIERIIGSMAAIEP